MCRVGDPVRSVPVVSGSPARHATPMSVIAICNRCGEWVTTLEEYDRHDLHCPDRDKP